MSSQHLNVIALISGGKDSFYSLLHCLKHGHRIVALANLYPPPAAADATQSATHPDLNSHMYQTAGYALIPLYEHALPFPLYRAPITGDAVDRAREYSAPSARRGHHPQPEPDSDASPAAEDETEALVPLIRAIQRDHPEANALSAGAILSTYQRTRIESVCLHLGLVPLAFLWQYPVLPRPPRPSNDSTLNRRIASGSAADDDLLTDVAASGLDARIVKVASGGLDGRFLWASLADPAVRRRVRAAVGRFGGSVLGEGGEYETLVVAGPTPPWRGRIDVRDHQRVEIAGEGGEECLGFMGGEVERLADAAQGASEATTVPQPALWDEKFAMIMEELKETLTASEETSSTHSLPALGVSWSPNTTVRFLPRTIYISNVSSPEATVELQAQSIGATLKDILSSNGLDYSDVIHTTILLRSMADFASVNKVYGAPFTAPLPPSRVTIALGDALPKDICVMMSFMVRRLPALKREGLHVQSRSYWAPANIGPYSQAISVDVGGSGANKMVMVAGQIPLEPSSMQVLTIPDLAPREEFLRHAGLSLQHLWRIGIERSVSWWTGAVVFLAQHSDSPFRASAAARLWQALHCEPVDDEKDSDDDDGPDIWDRQYGGMGTFVTEDTGVPCIPNFQALLTKQETGSISGFLAAEVQETPRNCSIEWQCIGLTGSGLQVREYSSVSSVGTNQTHASTAAVHFHEIGIDAPEDAVQRLVEIGGLGESWSTASALQAPGGRTHCIIYTSEPGKCTMLPAQVIPCHRVWGKAGRELRAGVVVLEES